MRREIYTMGNRVGCSVLAVLLLLLFSTISSTAQITINGNQTATALAQNLVGNGVTITNPSLSCPSVANGIFVASSSNLGLDSGIILTTGVAQSTSGVIGANGSASNTAANCNPGVSDAQLSALAQVTTEDACVLEFDFLPDGDTVKFDYVFASEEYTSYSCTVFNDVFAFFISGPGITGTKNLAVIPNTSIAVSVNSTTNPAVTNPGSLTLCQAMGTGSPFAQYYVNNSSGTTVTYDGFTKVLQAISPVIPCSTYHLKIAIADGSDCTLDSGVWLKAKSLTTNQISIKPVGGGNLSNPQPYCVRGCLPGQFVFTRPVVRSTPLVIKYQIMGSAVNGVDYNFIPDSVVILPGATFAVRNINGISINPAVGPKRVKLRVLNPYACSAQSIVDSAELMIYDSLFVKATTNDTSVCQGSIIKLDGLGDTMLVYQWKPDAFITDPTKLHTTAQLNYPASHISFELSATFPNSGCPPAHDYVNVDVREKPNVDAGPDRTTCLNTPVQFGVISLPLNQPYRYQWTSSAGLTYLTSDTSDVTSSNPPSDITYYIKVNPGAIACDGYDTVKVRVLPNDFSLNSADTAICKGDKFLISASGSPEFTYKWSPSSGVSNINILTPEMTPDTSRTYTIIAKYPNCPDMVKHLDVDVQPVPVVSVGQDREMCQWDTLQFHANVGPSWYSKYIYEWKPSDGIIYGTKESDMIYGGDNNVLMKFYATTPAGCTDSDEVNIIVHPGNFARITPEGPQGVCPNDTLDLKVTGGVEYKWTPDKGISNTISPDVKVFPVTKTAYTVLIKNEYGCRDTFVTPVGVYPEAVLQLEDSILLHPGESHLVDPKGNGLYFQWFPPVGLSASNIANPVIKPEVNTRYFITTQTEWGCVANDSIDVLMTATELHMPNAFVPGRGPNGNLKIIKQGIATLKYFRIFNRWGNKVFETTNLEEGWDGLYNGEPQPMGVYIYQIDAVTDRGERFTKQGNVTLIR